MKEMSKFKLTKNTSQTYREMSKNKLTNNSLQTIRDIFSSCDVFNNRKICPIPSIRYHFIDVRLETGFNGVLFTLLEFLRKIRNEIDNFTGLLDFGDENYINILNYHVGFDVSLENEDIFKIFFTGFYGDELYKVYMIKHEKYMYFYERVLNKSINYIEFDRFKECYINSLLKSTVTTRYISELSNIPKFSESSPNLSNDCFKIIEILTVMLLASQMDIYFLLRWFQNYDVNPIIDIHNKYENECLILDEPFNFFE